MLEDKDPQSLVTVFKPNQHYDYKNKKAVIDSYDACIYVHVDVDREYDLDDNAHLWFIDGSNGIILNLSASLEGFAEEQTEMFIAMSNLDIAFNAMYRLHHIASVTQKLVDDIYKEFADVD